MRNYLFLFFLVLSISLSAQETTDNLITEDLFEYMNQNPEEEQIRINIRLNEKLEARIMIPRYAMLDRSVLRETVKAVLKKASRQSQASLVSFLNSKPEEVDIIHAFWITNVVTCLASPEVINELARRNDIARIDIDEERYVLIGEEDEYFASQNPLAGDREITYNVTKVNAPGVWDLGFTGEGIIVAVLDTGVNYDHDDLEDHMWEDPDYPNHGWDFINNDNNPMDDHMHGTHCAGTVAGDGTAGWQTGIAPNATIMALKVLSFDGSSYETIVWQAIEFAVDNGADVLSMSFGWKHSTNPDREAWRNAHDNALDAGVIASVAAGNEAGSVNNPDDVLTPGDCPPPWLNPDQTLEGGISSVVCVGATDQSDNAAWFSSRGPSEWEFVNPFNDYPFNPEMGLLRPDVAAPGVSIKSCYAFNPSGYVYMSGTSMATPCVAGVMALLLSKNPALTPADISEALETTSLDLGDDGKDNVFGAGRVDALLAVNAVPYAGIVYNDHMLSDENGNGEVEAGESILLSLEMYNVSSQSFSNVEVTISSSSPYVTITDNQESYGNFTAGEFIIVTDGFAFDIAEGTPGEASIEFDVEATSGTDVWYSTFFITTYGPNIKFGTLHVDDADKGNGNGVLDPGESADLVMMVHNYGQVDIADLEVEISTSDELVTITGTVQNIDSIPSESAQKVVFAVNVDESMPVENFVNFSYDIQSGAFGDTRAYTLGISFVVEDWESASFDTYNWLVSAFSKWKISDMNPYEGMFTAVSGTPFNDTASFLMLNCEVPDADSVSFYFDVSSEENHDFFRFYIDNEIQGEWSGEVAWNRVAFPLSSGTHSLKWEYFKDDSGKEGDDHARVDFITLPLLAIPATNAGEDASICDLETYQLQASAENYTSLEWISSGDGTFNDESIIDPVYTPGAEDMVNHSAILSLIAYGHSSNVADDMMLTILSAPGKIDTPTGDTELCMNPGATVYSVSPSPGNTYEWVIEPSSSGTTESDVDTAVVVWNEVFTGLVTIKARAINLCGEGEFSDVLEVTVHAIPEVNLGDDEVLCGVIEYELDAGNGGSTYLWSTDETTQTIMATGSGETQFWVQVTNENGCAESDTITLNFASTPEVNLGQDTIICHNESLEVDAGNTGSTYLWSTGETTQKITIVGDEYGIYDFSCEVTNTDGCSNSSQINVEVKDCTGIEESRTGLGMDVFPNPFSTSTTIDYELKQPETVRITFYNQFGKQVDVIRENQTQGLNKVVWTPENLADGIYYFRLQAGEQKASGKLVLVR